MPYLRSPHERATIEPLSEVKRGLPQLLSDGHEPRVDVESYESDDCTTTYVVASRQGLNAQRAAEILEAPIEGNAAWWEVQYNLRAVGHSRPRIVRAMQRKAIMGHLGAIQDDAAMLAEAMKSTDNERIIPANGEVMTYASSLIDADKNLRILSSDKLQSLLSIVLQRDVDVRRLKNWLRAVRKRPDTTPELREFFEELYLEMVRENHDIDTNDPILEALPDGEYDRLLDALHEEIFEQFPVFQDILPRGEGSIDDVFVHRDNVPFGTKSDKLTKIDLGAIGLARLRAMRPYKGNFQFRTPVKGRVIRPILIWETDREGSRHLRFDTFLYGNDEAREQTYHPSPLVGAAALAVAFGGGINYRGILDKLNPYVTRPKRAPVHEVDRAGLWPLVAHEEEDTLLHNDYVLGIEESVERNK